MNWNVVIKRQVKADTATEAKEKARNGEGDILKITAEEMKNVTVLGQGAINEDLLVDNKSE